jgi:hypothetical protein
MRCQWLALLMALSMLVLFWTDYGSDHRTLLGRTAYKGYTHDAYRNSRSRRTRIITRQGA